MRLAVVWPRPRKDRWQLGRTTPEQYPDLSDALLFLEREGFQVTLEDSLGLLGNPLVRMHEFYSGLDPLRAARIALRARRYDAVACVGDATAYFLLWLRRFLGRRLPIVLIDPALSSGYLRRKRLQDWVLPQVEKVVVFGRVQLDYLREQYGGRVDATFLYHRADTEFYRPEPVPVARPSFLFSIGNDGSRDFDTLARAVQLCSTRPDFACRCVIHTSLPFDPATPAVEVSRGKLSYIELRQLYRQADLVALPLKDMIHAGGINSLLESMATARPVIVSGSRGVRDYVADGQTAVLVPPGDAGAMANAIVRLLSAPAEAARLGENARQFVLDNCSNPVYAQALAEVIRKAVRKVRPAEVPPTH